MVTVRAVLSAPQTDAIDHHRSLHEKHGPAGKRELQPEDGAKPGERHLVPALATLAVRHLPGQAGRWGSILLRPPPTYGLRGGSKTHE